MARNTIDYWMVHDSSGLTEGGIIEHIAQAPVTDRTTLQIYLHIPFCAQRCSFCAFSGGNSLDFKAGREYVDLLIRQRDRILEITPAYGQKRIRSVHIGGGSPDLVGGSIGKVLDHIHGLQGVDFPIPRQPSNARHRPRRQTSWMNVSSIG